MTNTIITKPDGLSILKEIQTELLSAYAGTNDSLSVKVLNNLLTKVNIALQIITYNPKLPLYQIEQSITEICKMDKSTHGVNCNFLFTTKFGDIDYSRLSHLTVKI